MSGRSQVVGARTLPQRSELHDAVPRSRLVAQVVRELLEQRGPAESLAELTGEVKDRLAALRIPASPDDVSAAYAMVQSNQLLVAETARADSKRSYADQMPSPPSRDEARALLAAIYARVEATPTVRQMPAVRRLSDDELRQEHFRVLQRRALEQTLSAIAASEERCAELDAEQEEP